MPLISDWQPSDPIQLLVYGAAKTGKTFGALTAPRPVVFDFDRGVATARGEAFVQKYGMRWIFYETFVPKMSGVVPANFEAFDNACKFFDEWMKPVGKWKGTQVGREQFDTFVIDSGTSLSELAQHKAVIVLGNMKLSKAYAEAVGTGVLIPRIQDYGSERSLVEQFVDMVQASGKNVILVCHEKENTNEAGNVTSIVPMFTGKSSEVIPMKFDEVYNLRIKKEGDKIKRYIQTEPDGIRKAGSRYGVLNGTEWSWDTVYDTLTKIKTNQRAATTTK